MDDHRHLNRWWWPLFPAIACYRSKGFTPFTRNYGTRDLLETAANARAVAPVTLAIIITGTVNWMPEQAVICSPDGVHL